MAAYLFADAIVAGRPIRVFNHGKMARDFTYVDDIVPAIVTAAETAPAAPGEHRVYNLGNNHPESLLDFIAVLERALGRKAIKEMLPMQPGDVATTYADIGPARRDLGFVPKTPISIGLPRFVTWYREYHGRSEANAAAAT
jgi:UDP-glucuronate 4-epimerase